MFKKVLSVALALVLALGVLAVATSAASASDLQAAYNALPNEYNARFYNAETQAAILEARAAAEAALESADAAAVDAAYDLCAAASTLAKKTESRYIEEEDEYVNYYVNREESNAVAEISLETDAPEYLKAGDTFNVTVSLDANFIIRTMYLGFAYDKTKLEFVSDAYEDVAGLDLTSSAIQPDWAHDARGREKAGGFPDSWTPEMKAQYNILCKIVGYDAYAADFCQLNGMTKLMTLTFKVKEDVEDGEALIFLSHDFQATFDNNITGYYAYPAIKFTRAYGLTKADQVADYTGRIKRVDGVSDQQATVDQTVNFTTEQITLKIGEAPVPADYSALDAAIAKMANYNQDDYTEESWAAYAEAVADGQACDRNLTAEDQEMINALVDEINNAEAALEFKAVDNCRIISVTPVGNVKLKKYATLDVLVEGSPWKIAFINSEGKSVTMPRDYKNVVSIADNGDGTETWKVLLFVQKESENYQVFARYYDTGWDANAYKYKLDISGEIDKSFYSWEVDGEYNGAIYRGVHTVTAKTGVDVSKIQFVFNNTSATYTADNATYEDVDGVRVWTFEHNFSKVGNISYAIKVRTVATVFETVDDTIDLIVVN